MSTGDGGPARVLRAAIFAAVGVDAGLALEAGAEKAPGAIVVAKFARAPGAAGIAGLARAPRAGVVGGSVCAPESGVVTGLARAPGAGVLANLADDPGARTIFRLALEACDGVAVDAGFPACDEVAGGLMVLLGPFAVFVVVPVPGLVCVLVGWEGVGDGGGVAEPGAWGAEGAVGAGD
jgi:hypothetical protein